jgi:predicted outer membrane repeat protein
VDIFFPSHFSASSWHGPQAFRSSSSSHYGGGIACVARCSRLMLLKITCLQSEAVKIPIKKCTLSNIPFRIAGNDKLHALIDEVLPGAFRLIIKTRCFRHQINLASQALMSANSKDAIAAVLAQDQDPSEAISMLSQGTGLANHECAKS